jgi:acyl carrier protein
MAGKYEEEILAIITRYAKSRGLALPEGGVDLDRDMADFGLESLDQVAIVSDIEDELGLSIDDDKIQEAKTLRQLIQAIDEMNRHLHAV